MTEGLRRAKKILAAWHCSAANKERFIIFCVIVMVEAGHIKALYDAALNLHGLSFYCTGKLGGSASQPTHLIVFGLNLLHSSADTVKAIFDHLAVVLVHLKTRSATERRFDRHLGSGRGT
jgi:hypothetical protein